VTSPATTLAAIGLKAIDYSTATSTRVTALTSFREACRTWHEHHGDTFLEKSSAEWSEMLNACDAEFKALKAAKAAERNAGERLLRACWKVSL
jgi:hypothetical protein